MRDSAVGVLSRALPGAIPPRRRGTLGLFVPWSREWGPRQGLALSSFGIQRRQSVAAMSESRIERVQRLFLSALEFPEDERETWLVEQCGDDVSLLKEVLTLLQHDEPSKDPLENPLHEAIADAGDLEKLDAEPDETCASDAVHAKALHVRYPHCHNPD